MSILATIYGWFKAVIDAFDVFTKHLRVLIIVDVQKCFCPGGGLAVENGDAVVPVINKIKREGNYDLVILTQDAHGEDHGSFFTEHLGKNAFDQVTLNGVLQTLWWKHGILAKKGFPSHRSAEDRAQNPDESSEFHDDLDTANAIIFQKGQDKRVDSYSGFYDNGRRAQAEVKALYPFLGKSTGLAEHIKRFAKAFGAAEVHTDVVGLALDYCVKFTAMDAHDEGFKVRVIADACRSISPVEPVYKELRDYGCEVIMSSELAAVWIPIQ